MHVRDSSFWQTVYANVRGGSVERGCQTTEQCFSPATRVKRLVHVGVA